MENEQWNPNGAAEQKENFLKNFKIPLDFCG